MPNLLATLIFLPPAMKNSDEAATWPGQRDRVTALRRLHLRRNIGKTRLAHFFQQEQMGMRLLPRRLQRASMAILVFEVRLNAMRTILNDS